MFSSSAPISKKSQSSTLAIVTRVSFHFTEMSSRVISCRVWRRPMRSSTKGKSSRRCRRRITSSFSLESWTVRSELKSWASFNSFFLCADKFDQFWAVNRRLMESVEQEGFKNIPLRCYNDVSCITSPVYYDTSSNFTRRTDPARTGRNLSRRWRRKARRRRFTTCWMNSRHLSAKQVRKCFAPALHVPWFAFYDASSLHQLTKLLLLN